MAMPCAGIPVTSCQSLFIVIHQLLDLCLHDVIELSHLLISRALLFDLDRLSDEDGQRTILTRQIHRAKDSDRNDRSAGHECEGCHACVETAEPFSLDAGAFRENAEGIALLDLLDGLTHSSAIDAAALHRESAELTDQPAEEWIFE